MNSRSRGLGYIQLRTLGSRQSFTNPVHLDSTDAPRIGAVRKHKLIIHDCLDFPAEEHARGVDRHGLVPNHGTITTVGDKTSRVGCEATEETLEDENR